MTSTLQPATHGSAPALPALPGRVLERAELQQLVDSLAARPDLWERHVVFGTGKRHFASLHRDADVDIWVLCWDTNDDTGWHDHDLSAGAVAVTRGAVRETNPRLAGEPASREVSAGSSFSFGPEHIHRMAGAVDGSVSVHAYSPPLWRMGQYSIDAEGVLRRWSVSYADELRPLEGPPGPA